MPAAEAIKDQTSGGASAASTAPAADAAGTAAAQAQPTTYRFGGKEYSSVDELGKAYESAQSELGKWSQQAGDLRRQYDEASTAAQRWNEWWKNVQPLWGDDVEKVLRDKLLKMTGAQPQAEHRSASAAFEGYEMLSPEQQAQRLRETLLGELVPQYQQNLQTVQNAWMNHLAQREQYYQQYLTNHLGLMRRALEEKVRNPSFDVDAVMEQAAKAIGGQIDPLTLGQQLLTAASYQSQMDTERKKAYDQAKKDFEQEASNKKMEAIPAGTGAAPIYKIPVGTTAPNGKLASLRERAAETIYKNFGPQWFRNE